jgi:histidine kinase-like protein
MPASRYYFMYLGQLHLVAGLRSCAQVITVSEFSFTYWVDPEPAQVGHAREQVRKVLPGWGLAEHDDLLELIVSELVTNALHCQSPIEVRLSCGRDELRIEVWDTDDQSPSRRVPGDDAECGRGLQLIDGLIEPRGGTRGSAKHNAYPGKIVYVVLPLPPRPAIQTPPQHLTEYRCVNRIAGPGATRCGGRVAGRWPERWRPGRGCGRFRRQCAR